ncbi:MAG: tetratricopeptide repeat protein [Myxococcota bacterium]
MSEARYDIEDAFSTICNHEEQKFKSAWEYIWQSCFWNKNLKNRKNQETQCEQLLITILNASPTHRARRLAGLFALFMKEYKTPGISVPTIESALAALSDIAPGAASTAHYLRCLLYEWRMFGPLNATELAQCQQEFESWNVDGDDASTLEARALYAECARLRGRARYAHDVFVDISRRWASQAPPNACFSAAVCLRQATRCALDLKDMDLAAARLDEMVALLESHFSSEDDTREFQIDSLIGQLLVAEGQPAIAATIVRKGKWLSGEDNERYQMRCTDLLLGPTVQYHEQRTHVEEPDDDDDEIGPRDETLEAFDRGDAAVRAHDLAKAHTHYREALRLSEHTGDDLARSTAHHKLAYVGLSMHRYAAALDHERRALALEREIERVPVISQTEAHIAELERLAQSQPPRD